MTSRRITFLIGILFATSLACNLSQTTQGQFPTVEAAMADTPLVDSNPTDTPAQLPVATPVPTGDVTPAPPVPAVIAPGAVAMIALGDSLTQGDGDNTGLGYPGRLIEVVQGIRPGSTMINLGQSGWNSDALINGDQEIASQLDRAVEQAGAAAASGHTAIALVWIGSNDLWYLYEYNDGSDELDTEDAAHFAANMDTIVSRLRDAGAVVTVALLDDQSKRPVALKGEAFVGATPDELARMSRQVLRYNEAIQSIAAHYGAITVDFYNTTLFTDPATLYDDGNHPNSAGYDIVARMWFDSIGYLLR